MAAILLDECRGAGGCRGGTNIAATPDLDPEQTRSRCCCYPAEHLFFLHELGRSHEVSPRWARWKAMIDRESLDDGGEHEAYRCMDWDNVHPV